MREGLGSAVIPGTEIFAPLDLLGDPLNQSDHVGDGS
jgi:hypothetical protein